MGIANNKTGLLLKIEKDLKTDIEELAKKDNRTTTGYIINLLKTHVNDKKQRE